MIEVLLLGFIFFTIFRIVYLISFKSKRKCSMKKCKTLVVIGSGGHTLEMMKLVKTLNPRLYEPRLYVMADADTSSEHKIKELEDSFQKISETSYRIIKIPRSRYVNQSYFTSVFTTLYSTLRSIPIVVDYRPDLILCNGPGTCIPVCIISFLLKALLFLNTQIVYVESICRVKTMSLSGKILLYLGDSVIVQWEYLHRKYPQTVFLGRLL